MSNIAEADSDELWDAAEAVFAADRPERARTLLAQLYENPQDRAALSGLRRLIAYWSPIGLPELEAAVALAGVGAVRRAEVALNRLLAQMPGSVAPEVRAQLLKALNAVARPDLKTVAPSPEPDRPGVVFDVSDLVGHFRNHRSLTGIQRVQVEVVRRALHNVGRRVEVGAFLAGRNTFVALPRAMFGDLVETAGRSDTSADPAWRITLTRAMLHLLTEPALRFCPGDALINIGSSWWHRDYHLFVRNVRLTYGVSYLPMIHDLVPFFRPEVCGRETVEDFRTWLPNLLTQADSILTISEATATDLRRAAAILERDISTVGVTVVPIGGDPTAPRTPTPARAMLRRRQLEGVPFVLLVSTLEPRKNHLMAFDAWEELIRRRGADHTPVLVCVGRRGWRSDPIFERLARSPSLAGRVRLMERVDDADLAALYQTCLFTVYPSHHEGWGLPVTESLAAGKVAVIARTSSLPEAGGPFSVYFEPNVLGSLVETLERLLDPVERFICETRLRGFRPRSWEAVAQELMAAADSAPRPTPGSLFAPIEPGRHYSLAVSEGDTGRRGSAVGDYRVGEGWLVPDRRGSRICGSGGALRLPVPWPGATRLYLQVEGLLERPAQFTVHVADCQVFRGSVGPREARWVLLTCAARSVGEPLSVEIRSVDGETIRTAVSGSPQSARAGVCVAGFSLCPVDDESSRTAFIEASALGASPPCPAPTRPL